MSLFVPAVLMSAAPAPDAIDTPPQPPRVFGGADVGPCGWPNVVAIAGACTGTLVHPRVVVYAAHCGGAETVQFAENAIDGPSRDVPTTFCDVFDRAPGELGRDFAYCILAEPVDDVPIVPPLLGCETQQLVPGAEVRIVGFGRSEDASGGIKREVTTTFHRIENDEAFIGGDGKDACVGDSGGPAFIKVSDESGGTDTWRWFGIVSHGDPECIEGSYYGLAHIGVPWFEERSGFDLTPCTDADGAWQPDGRCQSLPLDPQTPGGEWPDTCRTVTRAGTVATCGDAFAATSDDTPPTVTVVDPAVDLEIDGAGAVRVEISADDADGWGLSEVQLVIDGEAVAGGTQGRAPFVYEPNFPLGVFEISARAVDHAGNVAEAEPVLVAVGEPLPEPVAGTDTDAPDVAFADLDGCGCRGHAGHPVWLLVLPWLACRRRT